MKVSFNIKVVIHAKNDADAQALQKKVDVLLTKHARTLLAVEGVKLETITIDPRLTREP